MKYFPVVTIILGLFVLSLICIFVYTFDFDNDKEKYTDDSSSSNEVIIEYNDTSLVNHPCKDINIVDLSEYNNFEKNNVENKIKEENIQNDYTLLFKHFDHYSFITCTRKISDFSRHFKIENLSSDDLYEYNMYLVKNFIISYNLSNNLSNNLSIHLFKYFLNNFVSRILEKFRNKLKMLIQKEFKNLKVKHYECLKKLELFKDNQKTLQILKQSLDEVITNNIIIKNKVSEKLYRYQMSMLSIYLIDNIFKLNKINNLNQDDAKELGDIFNIYFNDVRMYLSNKVESIVSRILYLLVQQIKVNSEKDSNLLLIICLEIDLCYKCNFKKQENNLYILKRLSKDSAKIYKTLSSHCEIVFNFSKILYEKNKILKIISTSHWSYKWLGYLILYYERFKLLLRIFVQVNYSFKRVYLIDLDTISDKSIKFFENLKCLQFKCKYLI